MSPCILQLHSKSCLPQGLDHSLRARPDQATEEGQLLFADLAEEDPVRALAGNKSWIFLVALSLNRLLTLAPPGNKTVHFCSQGSHSLASRDPCPPVYS